VYPGEGGALGISIYPVLFFAQDAFAVIDPEGAGMQTIIKTAAQIGGPLEQFGTVGGKFSGAAKILYPERLVSVECVSAYSGSRAQN
jgi:N4-gp56 family major capsid protein